MSVYEQVKQALQDIVAPELKALGSEIKALQVEIRRLDEKIDSQKSELTTEIKRLDEKIDITLQIRERLATLEATVAAMRH